MARKSPVDCSRSGSHRPIFIGRSATICSNAAICFTMPSLIKLRSGLFIPPALSLDPSLLRVLSPFGIVRCPLTTALSLSLSPSLPPAGIGKNKCWGKNEATAAEWIKGGWNYTYNMGSRFASDISWQEFRAPHA